MAAITVKYRGALAKITGIAQETVQAESVKDVLRHIKTRYGGAAEKSAKTMLVAVNGESILLLKVYKTPLKNGDAVSFLPICGGG